MAVSVTKWRKNKMEIRVIECAKCKHKDYEHNWMKSEPYMEGKLEVCDKVCPCCGHKFFYDVESCDHACSPSDYTEGEKCDKMGCYEKVIP